MPYSQLIPVVMGIFSVQIVTFSTPVKSHSVFTGVHEPPSDQFEDADC